MPPPDREAARPRSVNQPGNDPPLIETKGLSRHYPSGEGVVKALDGVDVTMHPGEFVAAMGPSGSGKSTFLNLIGCLDQPTAGSYRLSGEDAGRLSPERLAALRGEKIGFVFQSFHLLPREDALANVMMPMMYRGIPARVRRERAQMALERVGLASRMNHTPSQLSGGQQQRVAIARALVCGPELILADEPTGALDSRTGLEIMALFQALNRAGVSILCVTHDADVAAFTGRTLRFRDGRLFEDERHTPVDAAAMIGVPHA